MEGSPRWRFREMRPGEINVDPIEGEFFTTEALGSVADALVRESIQNSLDAGDEGAPVLVRFSFLGGDPGRREALQSQYLEGLVPHLRAGGAGLQDVPVLGEDFSAILIEDYGTRGLQGDVRQYDDLDEDVRRNDFYYFWRNVGRTGKGSTDLGRWGLGKTVFQAASRINCLFGLTVPKDTGRALLMGQSVLKIHRIGNKRYAPYGYFGVFDNDLALPVEDTAYLEAFAAAFGMDRHTKPGLSILVPHPDRDLQPPQCILAAVRHYFFPMLSGKLVVEFRAGAKSHRLDAASLEQFFSKSKIPEKRGMLGLIAFARWAIGQGAHTRIPLREPAPNKAPKLREDLFDPEGLERAKALFSERRRVAFSVPVHIHRQRKVEVFRSRFSVFLEKDSCLDKAEDHFIRQGITIPEVTSLRHKGIRAVVSITEPALSEFLGDAENPAHTEWERNSRRFKKKYRLGPSTLDFIKSSPRELVKLLTQPVKGRDEHLLRHIFSLPVMDVGGQDGGPGKMSGGEQEPKADQAAFLEVPGEGLWQLHSIKGGFRLSKRPAAAQVPRVITIWAAYEVRNGNPFKKYTPLDFDMAASPMEVRLEGARSLLCKHNVLQVEVHSLDFKVSVTGFDIHRDLRIKTYP